MLPFIRGRIILGCVATTCRFVWFASILFDYKTWTLICFLAYRGLCPCLLSLLEGRWLVMCGLQKALNSAFTDSFGNAAQKAIPSLKVPCHLKRAPGHWGQYIVTRIAQYKVLLARTNLPTLINRRLQEIAIVKYRVKNNFVLVT